MAETIRHGIEKAQEDLVKENQNKLAQEVCSKLLKTRTKLAQKLVKTRINWHEVCSKLVKTRTGSRGV